MIIHILVTFSYIHGKINSPETSTSKRLEVHIYYNPLLKTIDIPAVSSSDPGIRRKYFFYAAISPSQQDALSAFKEGEYL